MSVRVFFLRVVGAVVWAEFLSCSAVSRLEKRVDLTYGSPVSSLAYPLGIGLLLCFLCLFLCFLVLSSVSSRRVVLLLVHPLDIA